MSVRLLLIDDNPFDRELAGRALEGLSRPPGPADIRAAADWEEALPVLERERLDLILLDYHLPSMSGLEILRRLHGRDHPPVIMLTGQDDLSIAVETLRAGACDYVPKSASWDAALCMRVESVLGRVRLEEQIAQYQDWLQSHAVELEDTIKARTTTIQAQAREIEQLYLRAEEAARIRDDILANVSHEFRTPLQAILGFTELLEVDLADSVSHDVVQSLAVVRENGHRLLDLVDTLLGIVRLRAGHEAVAPGRFSVRSFLEDLRAEAVVLLGEKRLDLDWKEPQGDAEVVTDRKLLRAIAYQLLSNAIKFTHAGRVDVTLEPTPNDGVRLTVTDSGIGLPLELRETVFEDFRQGDGSSTRPYGGLGLGLSIVKRHVALLGGTLSFTSAPTSGTTVLVELPGRGKGKRERRAG